MWWALAGVVAFAAAAVAFWRGGDDQAEIDADMETLAIEAGTPLPGAVGKLVCCRSGHSLRFFTEPAPDELIAWFEELPKRLRCESHERSDVDVIDGGIPEWIELSCDTTRNGRSYNVWVRTVVVADEYWTTIAVKHDEN